MDLRLAVRSFRRSPTFTLTAVLTLAVGIGGSAAIFTLVDAVLLEPLPYSAPDRLVRIWETNPADGGAKSEVSPGSFVDWRQRTKAFSDIAVFGDSTDASSDSAGTVLTSPVGTIQVRNTVVSANFFTVIGVQPLVGRGIQGALVADAPRTVVIGHQLWRTAFGADPDIVGKSIRIEGRTVQTVAGVMPETFTFPGKTDMWSADDFTRVGLTRRAFRSWGALGRLKDGASLDAARSDLQAISTQLAQEYPSTNKDWSVRLEPLHEAIVGRYRAGLLMLFGATALVVLVGCANVANLLLARGITRQRELAIRAALGATRARIARQLLVESLVLAVSGVAVGLLLAAAALPILVRLAADTVPRLDHAHLNATVFGYSALVSVATTMLIGLIPALRNSRTDVQSAISAADERSTSGPGRSGGQRWLAAVEIAASLILLVGAVLLIQSFVRLRRVDLGFSPANVVSVYTRVPLFRFSDAPPLQGWILVGNEVRAVLDRFRGLPGVEAAAITNDLPLSGAVLTTDVTLQNDAVGAPTRPPAAGRHTAIYRKVSPDYFRTMGMTIRRGRDFTADDASTESQLTDRNAVPRPGTIIVNDTAARLWWPDNEALGNYVSTSFDRRSTSRRRVVGILADVRADAIEAPAPPEVYVPYLEDPSFGMTIVVRTPLPPDAIGPMLRRELAAVDPEFSTATIRSMEDVVNRSMGSAPFRTLAVAAFSAVAVGLSAIGVYGLLAFGVARRRREIAIRVALGATGADITRLFLCQASTPIVGGIVGGLAGALALRRTIASLLYGVTATDPLSLAGAAVLLTFVAFLASYVPVRLALRNDPSNALRT